MLRAIPRPFFSPKMASWKHTDPARRLSVLLLLFFLLTEGNPVVGDLASDTNALLAFRAAVGKHLKWNQSTSACTWQGIQCGGSRVTVVRLPGVGLIGSIPLGTIGNLTELRVLSLRWNRLSGSIPSDLTKCVYLRNLYLQNNQFSGSLPSFISMWPSLVRLNLAFNRFTGPIPSSLNSLKRLGTLYLQNNSLTGSLPTLNLPNLQQFNVSNNKLNGSVPSTLKGFSKDAFVGNSLCGSPLTRCAFSISPVLPPQTGHKSKKRLSAGAIVGIVLGSLVLLLLLLLIV